MSDTDIAVVGLACRFPQAANADDFWTNLVAGRESITRFTDAQLAAAGVPASMFNDPHYVKARGMLEDIDAFDAPLFGVPDDEAAVIDPQQRMLLATAWHAFEDAGYDPTRFDGRIGVLAGTGRNLYQLAVRPPDDNTSSDLYYRFLTGNSPDYAATRISYHLDLTGVSLCVQAACCTCAVAVHLGAQFLLSGDCDMVVVATSNISALEPKGYLSEAGSRRSPDGHVRSFDARAAGQVPGGGVVALVLRRRADAERDGDYIRAVIKGSAANNAGHGAMGFRVPSGKAQGRAIGEALALSGIEPGSIAFVEGHGSGTALGDSIELAALIKVYGQSSALGPCALGSVKTNIGHAGTSSAAAGLVKAVLCLEHRKLVPSLHFERPNPDADFSGTRLYVNTQTLDWHGGAGPRRAALHSTGFGGTNAHIILEEAPRRPPTPSRYASQLLVLSARSVARLTEASERLAAHLRARPEANLADIAFTLQTGRRAFAHRRVLICKDVRAAAQLLAAPPEARDTRVATDEGTGRDTTDGLVTELRQVSTPTAAEDTLARIGAAWLTGASVDWERLHEGDTRRRLPLPGYPFEARRYWLT